MRSHATNVSSALRARRPLEPIHEQLDGHDLTPHDEIVSRADIRGVVADIGRLPAEQSSALVLAELEEVPHATIRKGPGPGSTQSRHLPGDT